MGLKEKIAAMKEKTAINIELKNYEYMLERESKYSEYYQRKIEALKVRLEAL